MAGPLPPGALLVIRPTFEAAPLRHHGVPGRRRFWPYTFVTADAMVLKVREWGRVVNMHTLVAPGVSPDGHWIVVGLEVTSRRGRRRLAALIPRPDRPQPRRDVAGEENRRPPHTNWRRVTREAHRGLVKAIGAALPGAAWPPYPTRYAATLMAVWPKSSGPWVRAAVLGLRPA